MTAPGLLRELKDKGAYVMAQDQATSSVWGMPRAVTENGCADEILGVSDIGPRICALLGLA